MATRKNQAGELSFRTGYVTGSESGHSLGKLDLAQESHRLLNHRYMMPSTSFTSI